MNDPRHLNTIDINDFENIKHYYKVRDLPISWQWYLLITTYWIILILKFNKMEGLMKSLATLFGETKGSSGLDNMGYLQQFQEEHFRLRLKIN